MLAGCGRRYASVSGSLLLPESLKLADTDVVQVIFHPDAKGEKAGLGVVNRAEKTYVCNDIVPGGKYKVSVRIDPALGMPETPKRMPMIDEFNKSHDLAGTKLHFNATDEWSQKLEIDLSKEPPKEKGKKK